MIKNSKDKLFLLVFGKLIGKYATNYFSRGLVFLLDLCIVILLGFISHLFFKASLIHRSVEFGGLYYVLILPAVYSVSFLCFGTYKGVLRYSGFGDIGRILASCFLSCVIICVFRLVSQNFPDAGTFVPGYVEIVFQTISIFLVLMLVRLLLGRIFSEYYKLKGNGSKTNVIVFGAGSGGLLVYNMITNDSESPYNIEVFVDDNFKKAGVYMGGIPVLLPSKILQKDYVRSHRIKVMILAIPSMTLDKKKVLFEKALDLGLEVKVIPHVYEFIENGVNKFENTVAKLRSIEIEDLLGRDPIVLENIDIADNLNGNVVLVTGAAGSIGSEIARQVLNYKFAKLILLDIAESPLYDLQFELKSNYPDVFGDVVFVVADVKDKLRMEKIFSEYKPDLVFHAAAYKHVPLMESTPYEAVRANVFGTKNVADLCIKYSTGKMVMISTDKAVNPTNVMGATKRAAEIYVQSRDSGTEFITTRFGNVLGSNGSVIPLFKKELEKGGPLTLTDKRVVRYFMTIPEACDLVLQAAAMGKGKDIFVFDMGEPVKIYDLAKKMIKISGAKDVEIVETGLRPGEKLYEELLANKESTIFTENDKIFRAKVRPKKAEEVDFMFSTLWDKLQCSDDFHVVEQMKRIVPEFISNNSIYCEIDKTNINVEKN